MPWKNLFRLFLIAALLGLPLTACDANDGPAEELGEDIDEAVEDLEDSAEDVGDEIEDGLEEAGDEVEEATDDDGGTE